jgi:hypothetical protein
MVKQIAVNGTARTVVNTLSYGPGTVPHTYELAGGSYVYEIAGSWFLQARGQFKQNVTVAQ